MCVFCGSRRQQNRLTSTADISEKGRQKRMKFSRLLEGGGLMYTMTQTGARWSRGSSWGTRILKCVKKICNAFLQAGLTNIDEFWHDGRY